MARQSYLIEAIMPENEVHLLAGPSGAGKTRLMFQGFQEWQKSETFLGFKCKPFPETLYLACDRSFDSVEETLSSFPNLDLRWDTIRGERAGLLNNFRAKHPNVKLLILDGLATLVPDGKVNDYGAVASFLCTLGKFCTGSQVTILGILHSPKVKLNEGYANPRQRILGSVAWGAFADTLFNLEPLSPNDPDQTQRRLFIGPRNHKEHHITLEYQNGLFSPAFNPVIEEAIKFTQNESVVYGIISTLGTASRQEIVATAGKINLSIRTVDRCLQSLTQYRVIRSERHGHFSVDKDKSLPPMLSQK